VFLKNVAQRRCFGKGSKGAMLLANKNLVLMLFLLMYVSDGDVCSLKMSRKDAFRQKFKRRNAYSY
jgi:hypothetical protein